MPQVVGDFSILAEPPSIRITVEAAAITPAASEFPAPGSTVVATGTFPSGPCGTPGSEWILQSDGTLVVDEGFIVSSVNIWGTPASPWETHQSSVVRTVFTGPIRAGDSLAALFASFTNLITIEGLEYFNTSNTLNMSSMFSITHSLTNLDLSSFNTDNVTNMNSMFSSATSLENLDLSSFNTSNVTSMWQMFHGTGSLSSLDLSHFDTRNVTNMGRMFSHTGITDLDLSGFDTQNVTRMEEMFAGTRVTDLDLSGFDTRNVTNMGRMFERASSLTRLNLSGWNTSIVTNMSGMFWGARSLTGLDLSSFDTGNVTGMALMFRDANSLVHLDLSSFDTRNVTNMSEMFRDANSLVHLDLSSFDTRNVTDMREMLMVTSRFTYLYEASLRQLSLGKNFEFVAGASLFETARLPRLPSSGQYIGVWRNIENGTADNPLGIHVFTSDEIMAYYDGSTMADTWVWHQYVPVTGVSLNEDDADILVGETVDLIATISPDNASIKNVTWESSDPDIATVENGLVTAVSVGETTITVTTVDGGFYAYCIVTVLPILVENVSLDMNDFSLLIGNTESLTATIYPYNATNQNVTWSSSHPNIASVNQYGIVTALSGGTATITVTTVCGNFYDYLVVTVIVSEMPMVSTPMVNPAPGRVLHGTAVALSTSTPGAIIRYTLDGSTPTEYNGIVYSSPIVITGITTIRARAFMTDMLPSNERVFVFDIIPTVEIPTATPAAGTVPGGTAIELFSGTAGAVIRFTTDGTEPTESNPPYTIPIIINEPTTIRARAFRTGWLPSETAVFSYDVQLPMPLAVVRPMPVQGNVLWGSTVSLVSTRPGATVRHTIDGSTPTASSPSGTITITSPTTVRARAFMGGWVASDTEEFIFNNVIATAPTVSPAPGIVNEDTAVTLSTNIPGAVIRFTTDGTEPTESSPIFSVPIVLAPATSTIRARVFRNDLVPSNTVTFSYVFRVSAPTSSHRTGSVVANDEYITLSTATEGATVHFTTDGTVPTATSRTGSFTLSANATVRARAFKDGFAYSDVVAFTYIVAPRTDAPTTNRPSGTALNLNQANGNRVVLTSATPGATIWWTNDGTTPIVGQSSVPGRRGSIPASGGFIEVNFPQTIIAIAAVPGLSASQSAVFEYTIGELQSTSLNMGRLSIGLPAGIPGVNSFGFNLNGIPATIMHEQDRIRIAIGSDTWGRNISHTDRVRHFANLRSFSIDSESFGLLRSRQPQISTLASHIWMRQTGLNPVLSRQTSTRQSGLFKGPLVNHGIREFTDGAVIIGGYLESPAVNGEATTFQGSILLALESSGRAYGSMSLFVFPLMLIPGANVLIGTPQSAATSDDRINYIGQIELRDMNRIVPRSLLTSTMHTHVTGGTSHLFGLVNRRLIEETSDMRLHWNFTGNFADVRVDATSITRPTGLITALIRGDSVERFGPYYHRFHGNSDGDIIAGSVGFNVFASGLNNTFNPSTNSVTPRDHLGAQSPWLSGSMGMQAFGANNLQLIRHSVYRNTEPLIAEANGQRIMTLLVDDGTREGDLNATILKYSIYNNGWGEPQAIFDNGTLDFYPSIASDGRDIWVTWNTSNRIFGSDATLADVVSSSEIAVARFDSDRGTFADFKHLTNNGVMDILPQISAANGNVVVTWLENSTNDISGTGQNNRIFARQFMDGEWGEHMALANGLGAIADLSVGHLGGNFKVAYVIDRDNDFETVDDRDLHVIDLAGAVVNIPASDTIISNVRFTMINGVHALTWFENFNIRYMTTVGGLILSMFPEPNMPTDDFRLISNNTGQTAVLYAARQDGTGYIMTRLRDGAYWGNSFKLIETGDFVLFFDGTWDGSEFNMVINNSRMEIIGEGHNAVLAESNNLYGLRVAPQANIRLNNVFYFSGDVQLNSHLPIALEVENIGGINVNSVDVLVNGSSVGTFPIGGGISAGETAAIEFDIYITSNMSAQTNFAITVRPVGLTDADMSDNTRTITLGHANLALRATKTYNDNDTVTVTADVENTSGFPAEAMLFVRRGSEDGEGVDFRELGVIAGRESTYVTFDFDPDDFVPYGEDFEVLFFEVVSDAEELFMADNSDFVVIFAFDDYAETTFPEIVSVGSQVGTLRQGEAGTAAFAVTVQDIPIGSALTFNNINSIPDISLVTAATTGITTTVEISTTAGTPQGSHPFTLTIAGQTSAVFTLTVGAPLPSPQIVSVGPQVGTLNQGTAGQVSFAVTTSDIDAGTVISLNNQDGITDINLVTSQTTGNQTTVYISTSATTPQGNHSLTLAIAGQTSSMFTLTVVDAMTDNIPVTGVSVAGEAIRNLAVGQNLTLTANITPSDATNPAASWTSSDDAVTSVTGTGIVTAVSVGTATITVRTIDGNFTASVTVNVTAQQQQNVTVSFNPNGGILRGLTTPTAITILQGSTLRQHHSWADLSHANLVPARTGHSFNGWVMPNGQQFTVDTVVTDSMTLVAKWSWAGAYQPAPTLTPTPTPVPTPTPTPAPTPALPSQALMSSVLVNGEVAVDFAILPDGRMVLELSGNTIREIIGTVGDDGIASFNFAGVPNATNSVIFRHTALRSLHDADVRISIILPDGMITFSRTALYNILRTSGGNDITFTVRSAGRSSLTVAQILVIDGNPAYEILVHNGRDYVTDFGGNVEVSLPHSLDEYDSSDTLVVYPLDENGELSSVRNVRYDYHNGKVIFTTTHFSVFMVTHNPVTFIDIAGHWASSLITQAGARGLVSGFPDGSFNPNGNVTRAEFVQMVSNVLGLTVPDNLQGDIFVDVMDDDWFFTAVAAARHARLLDGIVYREGYFMPNEPITRQEMADVLASIAVTRRVSAINSFNAEDFADYYAIHPSAVHAVEKAINAGFLNPDGMGDGVFSPNSHTTRAQAAVIQLAILRVLGRLD